MEEDERLFRCPFCKVHSYLTSSGHFRYRFSGRAPAGQTLIYFPYWRFKGMLFGCMPSGVQQRFLDVSQQALGSRYFPVSVGLRSQALALKFADSRTHGNFLKPVIGLEQTIAELTLRLQADWEQPVLRHAWIGETASLIYAPFYVNGRVYDAVLNQPVSGPIPDPVNLNALACEPPNDDLHFIATLCPGCGWELAGDRDSLILSCPNCRTFWRPYPGGLAPIKACFMPSDGQNICYLPFWRMGANVEGIDLATYADLIRMASLARVARPDWEQLPLQYWVPAFKLRPQQLLQVAARVTIAQPTVTLDDQPPAAPCHPVNLAAKEAGQTLVLIVAKIMRPSKASVAVVADMQVTATNSLLVYLPFQDRHHEWVQPQLNLAINKRQLTQARNL